MKKVFIFSLIILILSILIIVFSPINIWLNNDAVNKCYKEQLNNPELICD